MVRLVKGAYWDTEVKRAQERGLADYPVFTRKAMTDLCYIACARKLLAARPRLYPQFATHNALTVASVIEEAGGVEGYEFQRLHGMGEALYDALLAEVPDAGVPGLCAGRRPSRSARLSGAAAAGERRQLVVRRRSPPIRTCRSTTILKRPQAWIARCRARAPSAHPAAARSVRAGAAEFAGRRVRRPRRARRAAGRDRAASNGASRAADRRRRAAGQRARARRSTARRRHVRGDAAIAPAMAAAQPASPPGPRRRSSARAAILERAADLLEAAPRRADRAAAARGRQDARRLRSSEVREAVDYLPLLRRARRAARLRRSRCPARPARRNELRYRGRGVFVCISPWNFPLAIFLGQVAAALAAGNAVVAKPAEQTPLIAAEAVRLLHRGRRAGERAASRARRRQGRRGAGRRSARRRRRLHRLDRGRPRRSTARSPPRTARSCR